MVTSAEEEDVGDVNRPLNIKKSFFFMCEDNNFLFGEHTQKKERTLFLVSKFNTNY